MANYYGGPEGSQWKKKYEFTIPILLLILVVGVLAWQAGWLTNIPVIGGLFGGQEVVDVMIIGEDDQVTHTLDEVKVGRPINYKTVSKKEINDIRDASYLDDYELFILTENVGNETGELPNLFRDYLSQRLGDGTDLIMYGVAGSRGTTGTEINGWVQHGMDSYVPVTCPSVGACATNKTTHGTEITTLKITEINHDILKEFGVTTDFTGPTLEYKKVNSKDGSNTLANIEVETQDETATPGIVEKSYGMGGNAVYFAYHPSKTPVVFKNTIEYLAG